MASLADQLSNEILMARQRVYRAGRPTPLESMAFPGVPTPVWVKREDLGPINAYKWRGAANRMALLGENERAIGVVAASAGNHAQGVARAARIFGTRARIFMPRSTPYMKQEAVRRHGGDCVDVVLSGDSYDHAAGEALAAAKEGGHPFIHPYDDLAVMGGQGTLADEVVMAGTPPLTKAYVQIGGGGLAAATACWLKRYYPGIHVVGVEGVDQASMAAAVRAGQPVDLGYVDVFSDGTAVRRAGDLTFQLCRDLIDEFITVTNNEICNAVKHLWEASRVIPEPAGAVGLAGLMQQADQINQDDNVLVILCGANMDFSQLAFISRHAGIGTAEKRFIRFPMRERRGSLIEVLRGLPENINIFDVQYGRTGADMSYPVLGLQATPDHFAALGRYLSSLEIPHQDVTSDEDVDFRIISYDAKFFSHPLFVHIEFPERPGAFLGFMEHVAGVSNLCYFNYAFSGERVGRALIGLESDSADERHDLIKHLQRLAADSGPIRAVREVPAETLDRILGRG